MTFNDDAFKRLKDSIENGTMISSWNVDSLLARLEAAELALQWADQIGHTKECGLYNGFAICSCGFHQFYSAYEAWRKAAGR